MTRIVGRGFFYVRTDTQETALKLMNRPHRFSGGTTYYQLWVPGFNPNRPHGVFLPTWISIRLLPLEYFHSSRAIAKHIGIVLAEEIPSDMSKDHRSCIALDFSKGWIASVGILSVEGKMVEIPIDYDLFPLRCLACWDMSHYKDKCLVTPLAEPRMPLPQRPLPIAIVSQPPLEQRARPNIQPDV